MRRRRKLAAAFLSVMIAVTPAMAQDCSSSVQSAEEQARQMFINGMAGLANNSFSQRPGTFSSMACLDKFMSGGMDIMFRPPQLNDLLGQVLSFACQQAKQALTGATGGAGLNLQSLIGSLSGGGINLGALGGASQIVNLSSMLGGSSSVNPSTASIAGLFRR